MSRRDGSDEVAFVLVLVVAIVIVSTTFTLLWLALTGSPGQQGQAADAISRFVSVIIAALVGYMAGRRSEARGQAIVELALIMPLVLFLILGSAEAGFLLITKAHQDRSTAVVAEWAADNPNSSWNAIANKELPHCNVEVSRPVKGLVEATSLCHYQPRTGIPLFDLIPISSRETAVERTVQTSLPDDSGGPDTSPAASPSS